MSNRTRNGHCKHPLRKSILLLGALAGLALPTIGYSATYTVTDGGDGADANPGDGRCASSLGICTLRAAIQESNHANNSGLDTILLQTNVSLSSSGTFEDGGQKGDLDIADDLIIEGSGATRTVNANGYDRVFHIQNGAKATLRNLKITGGMLNYTKDSDDIDYVNNAPFPNGIPKNEMPGGGGILVEGASTLNLESVELTNNGLHGVTSVFLTGGGLYVDEKASVYIKDSQITDNEGPGGGGIANYGGHTEIRNTHIVNNDDNQQEAGGGAIRNIGGYLHIGNSEITANTAGLGGGISNISAGPNIGNAIINNSWIHDNKANRFGGGIYNQAPLTLTNSTISNNVSTLEGGAIYNTALGNMDIINSTISTNEGRSGGGIFNTRSISLTNVTLYNNKSSPCANCNSDIGNGNASPNGSVGGNQLANFISAPAASPTITAANTIIADGSDSNPTIPACAVLAGYTKLVTSLGGNLEGGNSCGLDTGRATAPDIINSNNLDLDPNLAIDTKYPITTPVHALLTGGGDAVDKANGSLCPQVDQRFLTRKDGKCDIGAYEFGANDYRPGDWVDLKLTISDSADPAKPNDPLEPLTYRVLLTNLYVNASAIGVVLQIKLPNQFLFTNIATTSTTEQPDCDREPSPQGIIECRMSNLPGLGRIEVFVTGHPTVDKVTITTEAGVISSTQDAFPANNRVTEQTVVDSNASTVLNHGTNSMSGSGGGGGTLHPLWLLTLGGLLLARRQRRR